MQSRQTAEEEQGEALFPEEAAVPYVPRFLDSTQAEDGGPAEELTGAARGTAYHHVLAVLDYGKILTIPAGEGTGAQDELTDILQEQLRAMRENGLLSEAEYKEMVEALREALKI